MNAYLEIIRPGNAVMAVIAVFLLMLISGDFSLNAFFACFVVFIITGAGNAVNDYFDHKIDAINKPKRPIPSGRISLRAAGVYSSLLLIIGTVIAFLIGVLPGVIALLTSLLLILYAYDLKKRPIMGNICVAFLTGFAFVFGGVVVGAVEVSIYLGFYAFLMTMAREIVKDMEDVEGDKEEGAETFPIIYGMKRASILAVSFIILDCITAPIAYFRGILTVFYLPVLFVGILIFLSTAISIFKDQSIENSAKVSKKIKIGMGVILLSFAAGSPFLVSLF